MNAWNAPGLNTAGRLTGWNAGSATASDCPLGQPFQVGAMDFFNPNEGGACLTVTANGLNNMAANAVDVPLAFVDYHAYTCPGCGTKSVTINLAVLWSVSGTPSVGQRDLQSVMAHEFGHVLGFGHNSSTLAGACNIYTTPTCAAAPNKSTMENINYPGPTEICGRDLGYYDILYANQIYP